MHILWSAGSYNTAVQRGGQFIVITILWSIREWLLVRRKIKRRNEIAFYFAGYVKLIKYFQLHSNWYSQMFFNCVAAIRLLDLFPYVLILPSC